VLPIQLGSRLLQKYRIDRFRRRKDGVLLYEGVDVSHARRISIKMLEAGAFDDAVSARFHEEARGPNVIDIGTSDGLAYFITTDCVLSPPPPPLKPPSRKPPPLPRPPSSKPPPLPLKPPSKKPPPLPADIPIIIDETAFLQPPPRLPPIAPPPPTSSDRILPTTLDTNPFKPNRAPWMVAFVLLATITGLAGWFLGQSQAHTEITPASAPPEPIVTQSRAVEPQPPAPIESVTKPVESAAPTQEAPEAPSAKPRHKKIDPLTI
jgi:hypothetical protein